MIEQVTFAGAKYFRVDKLLKDSVPLFVKEFPLVQATDVDKDMMNKTILVAVRVHLELQGDMVITFDDGILEHFKDPDGWVGLVSKLAKNKVLEEIGHLAKGGIVLTIRKEDLKPSHEKVYPEK